MDAGVNNGGEPNPVRAKKLRGHRPRDGADCDGGNGMKPSEVLKKYGWTKGEFARLKNGRKCNVYHTKAARFWKIEP